MGGNTRAQEFASDAPGLKHCRAVSIGHHRALQLVRPRSEHREAPHTRSCGRLPIRFIPHPPRLRFGTRMWSTQHATQVAYESSVVTADCTISALRARRRSNLQESQALRWSCGPRKGGHTRRIICHKEISGLNLIVYRMSQDGRMKN